MKALDYEDGEFMLRKRSLKSLNWKKFSKSEVENSKVFKNQAGKNKCVQQIMMKIKYGGLYGNQ